MVQAEILHRTRARWPGRNKTRNRILRAGTSAEGCRGIPRKRGSGGGPAGAVRRPRDTPGDPLVSTHRWERNSPRRAKPCKVRRAESSRPTGVMVHGERAATRGRPYGDPRPLPRHGGRGKPPPLRGERGNILRRWTGERNPVRRRAESSRPTGVTVYGGRAGLGPAPTAFQAKYSRTRQWAEKLTPASVSDTAPYSWPRRRPPPPAFQCRPQSRRRRPPRGPSR